MILQWLLLISVSSFVLGDISEKLKQGQGFGAPAQSNDFQGLLAPFRDRPIQNVKGGFPSYKGAVKGGARQLGAGASNAGNRVPIPFKNHDGDDDENNLDRLCNDAFHSFLCKPVGPRKFRFDGNLRPGARLPPNVLSGSSSNVQPQQVPLQSGGGLLPTELDNDEGYKYPKPTNNVPTFTGYSYPKPPYNYEKPANQLAYPSQVAESVAKPSNEYLPSPVSTTTSPPPTIPSTQPSITYTQPTTPAPPINTFNRFQPDNLFPAQTNPQPAVVNDLFYQYPKPNNPFIIHAASQNFPTVNQLSSPFPQNVYQSVPSSPFPFTRTTTNPAVSFYSYSPTPQSNQYSFIPTATTVSQPPIVYSTFPSTVFTSVTPTINNSPAAAPSNNEGYVYPKPAENPIIVPESSNLSPASPELPPNNGYLPPVGAPVPKPSNVVFNSLPTQFKTFSTTTSRPFTFPVSVSTTTFTPPTFRASQQPISLPTVTSTIRPFTFNALPSSPASTPRPFINFNIPTSTQRPQQFNFASSNEVRYSAPNLDHGYLPPVNQPLPSSANEINNVVPFSPPPSPQPPTTTPKPLPRPSNEYLPQIDVRLDGSSTNLQPNIEGGSLLADEADAPSPNVRSTTTERTHTLEELCRDAFHSFLCKPIDKPRRRIDGNIRAGAKIPPHVMASLAAASNSIRRVVPAQSGGAILPTQQDQRPNVFQNYISSSPYQSTNVRPQVVQLQPANPPSLFLVAASDSSSLAKKFLKPALNASSFAPNYIEPQVTKKPATSRPVVSTTTSTEQPRYTQTFPTTLKTKKRVPQKNTNLEGAASSPDGSSAPNFQNLPTNNLRKQPKQSSANEGYNYPKPSKPFNPPTTVKPTTKPSNGYDYPKPKTPFIFPTTQKPQTSRPFPPFPGQTFGARLRPVQRSKPSSSARPTAQTLFQQLQQQEQQSQLQEDPFGPFDKDNDLPPASQFEILKP